MTDFERIGQQRLRTICDEMVTRFADDFIIGFLFMGRNLDRIATREYELAAIHLGAEGITYSGRPLPRVHRPLQINRGQFRRRLAIVRTVCREFDVDDEVIERWLDYERALEDAITDGTDCVPEDDDDSDEDAT